MRPHDHAERCRFVEELDRNFSVVASAGSGKTRAITDRVLEIARSAKAAERLPQLVVVTFTNRAADEMQQRARQKILDEHLPLEVQAAFNRAFFGTIHAFCSKLLANHGHYLGLPSPLELLGDDDDLWQEFVQQQTRLGRSLGDENRAALFRLAQARDMMELGRRAGTELFRPGELGSCPTADFSEVYAAAESRSRANISAAKAELRAWEERFRTGEDEYLRWPTCFPGATTQFGQLWQNAFAPLRRWVNDAARCVAAEVQRDYRDFRLERGVVNYADQIALADELLQHPAAAERIRAENHCVILDEAQDTDPAQFSVLLEITRPAEATGRWMATHAAPPLPGRFCMVGDFQQSIYGDRADLNHYRAVHNQLIGDGAAEELKFSVTFRLDQKQVDFLNATFASILNNQLGQVAFVELQPRPEVLPGQVVKVSLGADLLPDGDKLKDYQKARIEADELARWIKRHGLKKLRASSWRDVAVLCPRKLWLRTMAAALRRAGLPAAIQSESDFKGDSPAHAWLTALCTIMVDPLNGYEIVGVLREVFGVSDHDLAVFSEGDGSRFRIDNELAAVGVVSSRLRKLAEIRREIDGRALFDAIRILIEETQLRERLASLPRDDFTGLAEELDSLLTSAAEAEANGVILADFAETLRADFKTPRNVRLSSDDAIQLITSQKSKGSEWQVVIVPFLARDLRTPSPRYPCLLKQPGTGESLVALGKEDQTPEVKAALEQRQAQEMERLLYVAATRARHTLVLALDQEIFAKADGSLQKGAQLKRLLGVEELNRPHFEALATEPQLCEITAGAARHSAVANDGRVAAIRRLDQKTLDAATKRASEFVHKFNPSAYDAEVLSAADDDAPAVALIRARSTADSPATLYGRWWHSLLESMSWRDGVAAAEQLFEESQPKSPVPARSAAEWKLLRKLFSHPIFAAYTSGEARFAHAEFPFSWSIDAGAAIEGIIDLLLVDEASRKCLVLDWKTNRIAAGEEQGLLGHYRPQLSAYWKAVSEITGFTVEAGLYSTSTGKLLVYPADELATEWSRLSKLSAGELQATT
ncbi:MAG: UvrD-helicase domain-containing protein, partial [Verrucomicrobiota bacterium]|nr:UvrD-helicase domain-containing protein [Verrucomicrobiota bacterium]